MWLDTYTYLYYIGLRWCRFDVTSSNRTLQPWSQNDPFKNALPSRYPWTNSIREISLEKFGERSISPPQTPSLIIPQGVSPIGTLLPPSPHDPSLRKGNSSISRIAILSVPSATYDQFWRSNTIEELRYYTLAARDDMKKQRGELLFRLRFEYFRWNLPFSRISRFLFFRKQRNRGAIFSHKGIGIVFAEGCLMMLYAWVFCFVFIEIGCVFFLFWGKFVYWKNNRFVRVLLVRHRTILRPNEFRKISENCMYITWNSGIIITYILFQMWFFQCSSFFCFHTI